VLYGNAWPEPFLALAWQRMFQNAAHDSICGCSMDEVSAQVLVRYAEAVCPCWLSSFCLVLMSGMSLLR
jgi:alpha-mannosidase